MTLTDAMSAARPPADDTPDTRALARPPRWRRALGGTTWWVLVLDLVLIFLFTALSRDQVFWSLQNAQSLLLGGTGALLLALGLAMLLGAGVFDLSLGANVVLSSVVGARTIQALVGSDPTTPDGNVTSAVIAGLMACLLTGGLFGLVNGLVVAYLDINSLIATLGTAGIGTGIALLVTDGGDIGGLPPQMQTAFALRSVAGVPLPALIALVIAAVLWAVLRYTRYGLRTLAIGSSRSAAERAGLRIRPHVVTLAVLAGLLAGLAAFVDISRFGSTTVTGYAQAGLAAVTAVVIGGTMLEGGRVSIPGAVWGTVLAVVLQGGLVVLGVAPYWQLIAVGAVLIAAVTADRYRLRRTTPR